MRKLASIQEIADIQPIPNADAIEVVTINGWKVVTKKGEFQKGDKCVYFEIDSFLPVREEFEFLRRSSFRKHPELGDGFRLKTIRLRKQLSQGLALPANILLDKVPPVDTDVTELLGVKKYEIPEARDSNGKVLNGGRKRAFPSFLRKTDEERIQNKGAYISLIEENEIYVAEKLDGSSITIYLNNGKYGVCSRNLQILEPELLSWFDKLLIKLRLKKPVIQTEFKNDFRDTAKKLNIEEKLRKENRNIAIQGELIGPGIQKNIYKLDEHTIKFFSLFDIDKQEYAEYADFIETIERLGLDTVPILETPNYSEIDSMDKMLEFAEGKSVLNDKTEREGVVIRTKKKLENGVLSFKVISNKFLLKDKD